MIRCGLIALFLASQCLQATPWQKLEKCTLAADEYGDGDSFHVRQVDKDFIFRLYFVDCPESDDRFPDRVAEQAKYFGISATRSIALGATATEFTRAALKKPFTVWTKWQDARGSSAQHRFYAVVVTSKGYLSSRLVSNGLARVFGMNTELPEGEKEWTYVARLKGLEAKAKAGKRGAWKVSNGTK